MASRAVEEVSLVIMSKANITRFDNNLDAYMFDRLRKGAASSPSPPPRPYLPLPACVLCLPARSHTNSSSHAFLCQMIPRACSPCGWPRGAICWARHRPATNRRSTTWGLLRPSSSKRPPSSHPSSHTCSSPTSSSHPRSSPPSLHLRQWRRCAPRTVPTPFPHPVPHHPPSPHPTACHTDRTPHPPYSHSLYLPYSPRFPSSPFSNSHQSPQVVGKMTQLMIRGDPELSQEAAAHSAQQLVTTTVELAGRRHSMLV
jgi:hypothetical protein